MTPHAQISIALLAFLSLFDSTSGAIYLTVPKSVSSPMLFRIYPAIPKSTTFISRVSMSENNTFSSFKSLWIMPF